MPFSIPQVCNMALAAIGHSQFIDNINEGTQEANVCKIFYDSSKQQMLRDTRPNWAREWLSLALVAEQPNSEWLYAYRVPSDCLKVLYIPSGEDRLQPRTPYATGLLGETPVIYTNTPNASAVIVRDVSEKFFDPSFADLLSLHLATKVAMPLSVDPAIQRSVDERFLYSRNQAMTIIANEEQLPPEAESERVTAAYGYGYNDDHRG
jgi:hypothetical protein